MEAKYAEIIKPAAKEIKELDKQLDERTWKLITDLFKVDGITITDPWEFSFVREWLAKMGDNKDLLRLYKLELLEIKKAELEEEISVLECMLK